IDEAYIDFAGKSALELISKYENLLVVQTFSKARSLAGMRIGYAMGHPKLIQYLNDVKYSFNSYTMSQAALTYGVEAVKDREYFEAMIKKIVHTRDWTAKNLQALGFDFPDPKGNFIFATHPQFEGKELFLALKSAGIYVRYWDAERINQYLRITIGTQSEMELLITFLKNYKLTKGE
ncbi:MAG: aminotransferase class I/II-fold pyridoxal phosphate-dependent enzyme, partial [Lachnospiraceae bacterium]